MRRDVCISEKFRGVVSCWLLIRAGGGGVNAVGRVVYADAGVRKLKTQLMTSQAPRNFTINKRNERSSIIASD